MARALIAGDIVQVQLFCENENQESINTLHYRVGNVLGGAITDLDVANSLDVTLGDAIKDLMGAEADYMGVRVQVVSPAPKAPFQIAVANAGAGTVAQDTLPPQVAGLLTKLTAKAGSRYRGLVYFAFLPETFSGAVGSLNTTGLTALNAFGAIAFTTITVASGLDSVDLAPVIWSRKFSTAEPIVGYRPEPDWGTHKSRSYQRRGDRRGP